MDTPVIDVLQKAREKELYAISQYLSHHEQLEFMGYGKLADEIKNIAIQEMKHAGTLARRIKVLLHEPVDFHSKEIEKHKEVCCIFDFNAELEEQAMKDYNEYIKICYANNDAVSAGIFIQLTKDEQEHFNYFDRISNLIKELGDAYLATLL